MGLINTAISNLLGGVSQQADSLRGASNCEEQINAYPSPVEGLVKRPATQAMGDITDYEPETSHLIDRDKDEKYIVSVTSRTNNTSADLGGLRVWDVVNNEEKTVYYDTDSLDYLVASDLINSFKFTTAGDVTYIANTEVTPLMETTVTDDAQPTGMVHVRQGAHETSYYVDLNGTQYAHHATTSGDIKTDSIAAALAATMNGTLTINSHLQYLGSSTQGSAYQPLRMQIDSADIPLVVGDIIKIGSTSTFSSSTWKYRRYYYTNGGNNIQYDTTPFYKGDEFKVVSTSGTGTSRWVYLEEVTGGLYLKHSTSSHFGSSANTCVWEHASGSNSNTADFTVSSRESTITVSAIAAANNEFSLEARDTVGDTYIKAFKKTTQYFSDLPTEAYSGTKLQISGNAESGFDDYYVNFKTNYSTFGQGAWEEIVGYGVETTINPATMPHILIRQADGTFLFKPADGLTTPTNVTAGYAAPTVDAYDSFTWEDRKAGDDETNPLPNFIGNNINDIFFYENRLGILSGESVTLSESGQFFNFFRTTVIDLLDTAPIEVVGSSNSVNTLRHAIPFNGNLILFGDNTQFMLGSGREGLSPKNVAMSQASNYECDPQCKPIVSGSSVFFGFERGNFGGAREMVISDPEARDLNAFDITAHIPSYIPTAFQSIVAMPQENLIICLPKLDHKYPNKEMRTLYFYKYLDRGNERVQSAWFKYELEIDYDATHWVVIKNIHVAGNVLYIHHAYIKRDTPDTGTSQPIASGHSYYWKMEFTDGDVTDLHKTPPLLDNCVSYEGTGITATGKDAVTAVHDPVTDLTTFTIPIHGWFKNSATIAKYKFITKYQEGVTDGGTELSFTTEGTKTNTTWLLNIAGDQTLTHLWFGKTFDMTYKYAHPIFKGPSSGGGASLVTSGRYQVHSADIVYSDTNTFDVAVSVEGRSDYSYAYLADTTEVGVDAEGGVGLDSGDMRIPIHAKNDTYDMTITSSSPYPVKLLSTEFESQYNTRSKRLGI
jgi:hypothetical protein